MSPRIAAGAMFVMLSLLGTPRAESAPAPEIPAINDAQLLKMMSFADIKLAPRLFTPELVAAYRRGELPGLYTVPTGNSALGKQLAAELPEEKWWELIVPYAAFTNGGPFTRSNTGTCPFCGKPYGGIKRHDLEQFLKTPFQAKTICCDATVYERETDMPPDYPARPNHTEKIPHLDGTEYEYRFYVPPGTENAGIERESDRKHWFCSASEVWLARSNFLHAEGGKALLSLAAAV